MTDTDDFAHRLHGLLVTIGLAKNEVPTTVHDAAGNNVQVYTKRDVDELMISWASVLESIGSRLTDYPERLAYMLQRPSPVYTIASDLTHMRTVQWSSGSTATLPLCQQIMDRVRVRLIIPATSVGMILSGSNAGDPSTTNGAVLPPGTNIVLDTKDGLSATPVSAPADALTQVSVIEEHITPSQSDYDPQVGF